jgi:ABC-2 type transport system ATP-binding protein
MPVKAAPMDVGSPSDHSPSGDGAVVAVRGLTKAYGGRPAVRGIDLAVARGEVFALLGPNGAGKTTTVEILEGFRHRDGGEVSVFGLDPARGEHALKARIGIVLQTTGIDMYLSAAESVELLGAPYPRRLGTDAVLEMVDLSAQRDQLVRKLSGGQRRRLDLAVALVGDPDLLFLDEPTTGFDPSARRDAWDLIKDLARRGKTIFLTTHYMEEAEYLADRVAILVDGRIVATGPPGQLGVQTGSVVTFRLPPDAPPLPPYLTPHTTDADQVVSLVSDDPTQLLHDLTEWALGNGFRLLGLEVTQPSLEDTYLQLTDAPDDAAGRS